MNSNIRHQLPGTHEQREETRYPFHWPVELVFANQKGQCVYPGRTFDVSTGGCSVLTEYNIAPGSAVTVHLALPATVAGAAGEIVSVAGRIAYTVLSAGHGKFRSGIEFLKFSKDGQRVLLAAIKLRAASSVGRSG